MHTAGTVDFLTGKGRVTSSLYDTRPRSLAFNIKKNNKKQQQQKRRR